MTALRVTGAEMYPPRWTEHHGDLGDTRDQYLDISVSIKNYSNADVVIMAQPRRVSFDQATNTLFLDLSDANAPPDLIRTSYAHTQAIVAGASTTVLISLPVLLTRFAALIPGVPSIETADISKTKSVRCRVAFGADSAAVRNPHANTIDSTVAVQVRDTTHSSSD